MKQLTELIKRFLHENIIHHRAWKHIDEGFDHEIYLEMNPENCSHLLSSFDSIKRMKWEEYAQNN